MKYKYHIFMFALLLWILPGDTFAYELKVAPDISISENYISDNNLYLASVRTWFNATYEKDIVSVALDQTIQGTVFGDATLLGKTVSLSGESFGDVRVIADTVFISGVVNEDLIITARNIFISPEAIINGDTLILGHTVVAQGQFLGESQITASKITVQGSIVGPTTLTGTRIVFGAGSKVISEISYFSPQRAVIESGAIIQQQPSFNQVESITQNDVIKRLFFGFVSFWAIIKLIATLFVIFILTHLFRVFVQRIVESVKGTELKTLGIGAASLVGLPVLIVVLFGSLVLILVGVIVASVFVIMIMLLPALSSILLATFYQQYVQKKQKISVDFNLSALMLIYMTFVGFIPYVGGLFVYVMYIISFGALATFLYGHIRRKKINL